jgi:hypothetical protein
VRYCSYENDQALPIIDGGRTTSDRCGFRARGLAPGKPLVIVRRSTGRCAACMVQVNGRSAGVWPATEGPTDRFRDDVFEVPPSLVTGESAELMFDVAAAQRAPASGERAAVRVIAYYYWLAQ